MRFLLPCVALAFVTAVAPPGVGAQDPAPAAAPGSMLQSPSPGPPKFLNQNIRIDVTIALKGDAKPLLKNLSMVASDGRETKGRAGIEIPVPTQVFGGSGPVSSFTYKTLSVNVDATPQLLDPTHVLLRLNLQFTTVYKSESGQSLPAPSFGQGSHEVRGIVFESGKPIVVTQSADGETGREYTVEVKATILK
jgi:hypothetical protein